MKADLRDTRADAKRRKRERRWARRDPDYLRWIKGLPCHVCGVYGVEAHHWPTKSNPAWHDTSAMPLCPEHHRGEAGYHQLGRKGFEAEYGLSLAAVVLEYRGRYLMQAQEPAF